MARLAALGKAAVVRILMAIGALVERNTHVLRLPVGSVGVALGALHLGMQAGQWIACLRVIELCGADGFPVLEVMALLAGRTESALVLVFMTANASGREPEICPAQILDLDCPAVLSRDVGWVMALVTGERCMLALEGVSRFCVVEGLDIPLDQREVFAIVLGVAARTLLA